MPPHSISLSPSPSEIVECFHCGSCEGKEWLDHFIKIPHQRKSRKHYESKGWSKEETVCSLLLFSNFPLISPSSKHESAGVITFLQNCGLERPGIKDFLSWEEKPYVGIVQFRNRHFMYAALANMDKEDLEQIYRIKVGEDHFIETRHLELVGQLELSQILPQKKSVTRVSESTLPNRDIWNTQVSVEILEYGDMITYEQRRTPLTLDLDLEDKSEVSAHANDVLVVEVEEMEQDINDTRSLFEENINLSNTNRTQETVQFEAEQQNPIKVPVAAQEEKDTISLLFDYARKQYWPIPTFQRVQTISENKYLYNVDLGGNIFNMQGCIEEVDTEKDAKLNAATFVLDFLINYPL